MLFRNDGLPRWMEYRVDCGRGPGATGGGEGATSGHSDGGDTGNSGGDSSSRGYNSRSSPDANEGIGDFGQDTDSESEGVGYVDSWGRVHNDQQNGVPAATGYNTGPTGFNDGTMSFGDMSGYGLADKADIALGVATNYAEDHVGALAGAALGFALAGPMGALTGLNIGDTLSNFSEMDESQKTQTAINLAMNFAPLPPVVRNTYNIARNTLNPNATLAQHLSGLAFGTWGASSTASTHGALAGVNFGINAAQTVNRALGLANTSLADVPGNLTNAELGMNRSTTTAPTDTGEISAPSTGSHPADSLISSTNLISDGVWNGTSFQDTHNGVWNGHEFV